jgi:hypothetical protein
MIELKSNGRGCWAVPYRFRRRRKAVRLPDGAIVEEPTENQLFEHMPRAKSVDGGTVPGWLEMTRDGSRLIRPTDVYRGHACDSVFVHVAGVFVLPSGDVAAVYGANAKTLRSRGRGLRLALGRCRGSLQG